MGSNRTFSHEIESLTKDVVRPNCSRAEILGFLREKYQLDGNLKELRGERDQVVRLDAGPAGIFTLRISHLNEKPANLQFQNGALGSIAKRDPGLRVPRLVTSLEDLETETLRAGGNTHLTRLFSHVPGTPAIEVESSVSLRRSIGTTLARLDKALVDYRPASAGEPFLWNVAEVTRLRPLLSSFSDSRHRKAVEGVFEKFEAEIRPGMDALPWQVIHNDFTAKNVLVSQAATEVVGVIDFGDLVFNPRIVDLAIAVARQVRIAHALPDAVDIIQAYGEVQPLTHNEKRAIHAFTSIRLALRMIIYSWRRSLGDPRGTAELIEGEYELLMRLSRSDAVEALGEF